MTGTMTASMVCSVGRLSFTHLPLMMAILAVLAHSNNRVSTVLDLFEDIAQVFGYPSMMRGDHGIENLPVAAAMERVRGEGCGSYILGKNVHNIRIERLWVDMTSAFGLKWISFLEVLEAHDELDADSDAYIWLLHFLFLNSIDRDAEDWAATWNNHILQRRGQHHQSPIRSLNYSKIMIHAEKKGQVQI